MRHDHYGWPEAPRFAFRPVADAELIEVPVTIADVGGRKLATRRRVLPAASAALTTYAIRQVAGEGQPAVFYFHPWEIDPGQPRGQCAGQIEDQALQPAWRDGGQAARTDPATRLGPDGRGGR